MSAVIFIVFKMSAPTGTFSNENNATRKTTECGAFNNNYLYFMDINIEQINSNFLTFRT